MGFLRQLSTVSASPRLRASHDDDPFAKLYGAYMPSTWAGALSAAGVRVSPETAMTIGAFHAGVSMIAHDLATLPAHVFRRRDDDGKDRVRPVYGDGTPGAAQGIGGLAYLLRWQPNGYQTSTEWMTSLVAQYLMRAVAYAEIQASNERGFVGGLLPRHPDRVRPEMLPSGRVRYRLTEPNGQTRWIPQEDMLVVRDPLDGSIEPVSRVSFGANAIGTILAAEQAAATFFKSGMTAAVMASYKSDMEPEEEAALHASITRYVSGLKNYFGLLVVPDDVTVSNLAIEPEKAQMMAARKYGLYEVARMLHMPPHKLAIEGTQTYASQVQSAVDYVIGCLRPIAVSFEQAFQRDLIVAKDTYFVEFTLEALLRGDPDARAAYYERAIRNRWMRPTEVRLRENLNPDPELDRLSALDFRPGATSQAPSTPDGQKASADVSARAQLRGMLAVHDAAVRCLRRERAAVAKLATKHAADVDGWRASLRDFFSDHAGFIAETMRLDPRVAHGYAAQHGTELEARGIVLHTDEWERYEATELAALALDAAA